MPLGRAVVILAVLTYGGFGAAFLLAPALMAAVVDITLPTPSAVADFRATYGGFELGMSAFLAWCAAAREHSYDEARPAYQLGHLARRNPQYEGKPFEDVEPELRRGWSDELRARYGDWSELRGYVGDAYTSRREEGRREEGRREEGRRDEP